jgi:RHS repeat-associated protein
VSRIDVNYLTPACYRNYQPSISRWLSPDKLGGEVMNSQSLNRYAYALNNPATLNDPLGMDSGDPGNPCSDPMYASSHAECGSWEEGCAAVMYGGCRTGIVDENPTAQNRCRGYPLRREHYHLKNRGPQNRRSALPAHWLLERHDPRILDAASAGALREGGADGPG